MTIIAGICIALVQTAFLMGGIWLIAGERYKWERRKNNE